MSRNQKILLVVLAAAAAGYLGWRWWQARQAANMNESPTGSTGANLNSVAPELIGGSSGPSVGPALSAPVNITLNSTAPAPATDRGAQEMTAVNVPQSSNPLDRQNDAAAGAGAQPDMTQDMSQTLGGPLGGAQ